MALVGVGAKALNAPDVHTKPEPRVAASPAEAPMSEMEGLSVLCSDLHLLSLRSNKGI